jgi:hypothetical protein
VFGNKIGKEAVNVTAKSVDLQAINDASTSNERLKNAATLKAGYDAYKLVAATDVVKGTGLADSGDSAIGISFSTSINSSKQDSKASTSTARGTSIQGANITWRQAELRRREI